MTCEPSTRGFSGVDGERRELLINYLQRLPVPPDLVHSGILAPVLPHVILLPSASSEMLLNSAYGP